MGMNEPARTAPAGTRREDTTVKTDGIVFDGEEEIFAEILGNDLGDENVNLGKRPNERVWSSPVEETTSNECGWAAVVGGEGGKGAKNSVERGCSALLFGRSVGRLAGRAWTPTAPPPALLSVSAC